MQIHTGCSCCACTCLSRTEYNEAVDTKYETDSFFHGLDGDHSGSLTRDEFVRGWFNTFDTDKNDSLRRSEFEAAIGALEVELQARVGTRVAGDGGSRGILGHNSTIFSHHANPYRFSCSCSQ
ncbi:MAG: EF-hand domain-containing protein [Longimicrobiales bacterium]